MLCAGAAAGVSIIALKEIKNVRKELITLKISKNGNDDLDKRMLMMEEQFKILTDFIKKKENIVNQYQRLSVFFNDFLLTQECQQLINLFDKKINTQNYNITPLKKIDFIIWQTR